MIDPDAIETVGQRAELFISYVSRNVDRATVLHDRLVAAGFTVWFDKARLKPGYNWHKEIESGCEAARVIVPLLTPDWARSEWTRYETYGHAAIVPLLAEGDRSLVPPPLRGTHIHKLDPLTASEPVWQTLFVGLREKLTEPVPEKLPRIVDLPHPANPYFTGRDADLVRIHEELHQGPVAALTQGRVRALAAMGGVGKTTLANEYARRFWRLYPQILWVDARVGLESEFARLFGTLFPARAEVDLKQPDKARLAMAELSGPAERLLVIDNVEDAESVRPFLPRDATTGCRTLVTSRFADWPHEAGIRSVPLYVLEKEPSRNFLLTRTRRSAEGAELEACDALAEALGYLPLALEQAAAYIAAPMSGVNFAGYLRLYRAAEADLLARKALGSTAYPDPVITTWQTTVARLSPGSRAVLRLCAWYADTPIPRELIMNGAEHVMALAAEFGEVPPMVGPEMAELSLRDAITGLARYSMILDGTDESFRIHGLVQTVERVQAERDKRDGAARDRALERLTASFPAATHDPIVWPLCRLLLPHQKALAARQSFGVGSEDLAVLLDKTGSFLFRSGDACGALAQWRRALVIRERVLGATHRRTLATMSSLAVCLKALGKASEASRVCTQALKSCKLVLGPKDSITLGTMNNLAGCLKALGKASEALPLYTQALETQKLVLGPKHPDTLTTINNLASCLEALGKASEALPLYTQTLKTRTLVLGPKHPQTLISMSNLAVCLQALKKESEALPLHAEALESSKRVLGPEHPQTLTMVCNLASCLKALGKASEALPLYRRALKSRDLLLGPEHPDTLTTVNDLASCLEAPGEASEALPLHAEALKISERVLGTEHPNKITNLMNLALCLQGLGDADGALLLFRQALELSERVLGTEHPGTLSALKLLAIHLAVEQGDPVGSLPLLRRWLEYEERVLGPEHPDTLLRVANLASCLQAVGDASGALQLLRPALVSSERVLGTEHLTTRTLRANYEDARKAAKPW